MKRTGDLNPKDKKEPAASLAQNDNNASIEGYSVYKWLGRTGFLMVLFGQAIVLNHFLVTYENIKFSPHVFVLAYLPAVFFWVRGQLSHRAQSVAAAVWFLYSLPLAIIIGWIFVRIIQKIENDSFLDHGMLLNTLAMSSLVYLLLDVEIYSPRLVIQINWVKMMDILDHSDFFGLLLQRDSFIISDHFKTTIIAFGLFSILLTSVSLVRFAREHPSDVSTITDPQIEIARLLAQILLINFPFFALRIYIWQQYHIHLSVFTFKNFLMIATNFTQIVGHSCEGCSCVPFSSSAESAAGSDSVRSQNNKQDGSTAGRMSSSSSRTNRESRNVDLIDFEL